MPYKEGKRPEKLVDAPVPAVVDWRSCGDMMSEFFSHRAAGGRGGRNAPRGLVAEQGARKGSKGERVVRRGGIPFRTTWLLYMSCFT